MSRIAITMRCGGGSRWMVASIERFECKLDSGAFAACTSPKAFAGLAAGAHTVTVRAVDKAGNAGAAATRAFAIGAPPPDDASAPVTTDDVPSSVQPGPVTVTLAAAGAGDGHVRRR
jgi:hypothetical protein